MFVFSSSNGTTSKAINNYSQNRRHDEILIFIRASPLIRSSNGFCLFKVTPDMMNHFCGPLVSYTDHCTVGIDLSFILFLSH